MINMDRHWVKLLRDTYRMDETLCVEKLQKEAALPLETIEHIWKRAYDLVFNVRQSRLGRGGIDAFLGQYDLSSSEGIALMCMAEALLRIPDAGTIDRLIRDKIMSGDWKKHVGQSSSLFVNAATFGLMLTGKMLSSEELSSNHLADSLKRLVNRTSEPLVRQAVLQAMKILGRQFVMGETIEAAVKRAKVTEKRGYRYSYDMLGEAAKTKEDAKRYYDAYCEAIAVVGEDSNGRGPIKGPGISVKLSALHPRYEWVLRHRMHEELLPLLKSLALQAKAVDIGFTIDAEEADRLELSLELLEVLMNDPDLKQWMGLGLAVQAYQKRATVVIDGLITLARRHQRRLMVRLVKGAYWDSEIKWSQEKGYISYPVFTRKTSTDVSYIACVKKMLDAKDVIYPQFATHNAYTVATILELAQDNRDFEFQCLHGMGDTLYDNIVGPDNLNISARVYAPVGGHDTLLGYLVRRLLENGANTSFVNRIIDEQTPIDDLITDPTLVTERLIEKAHPKIPTPPHIYGNTRPNSLGIDISNEEEISPLYKEMQSFLPTIFNQKPDSLDARAITLKMDRAHLAFFEWELTSHFERARCLERMAHLLEKNRSYLLALLVREAGKTIPDSISELREAIDFCWYYRQQLLQHGEPLVLPGPTGEHNQLSLRGRGVIACISPWNFPLAIFLGQVLGAITMGNTVIAKPAGQTPLLAEKAIALLHEAGIPKDAVQCIIASGKLVSETVLEHPSLRGVMFTGSTETGKNINLTLANRNGPILPLIAETGGQNAMIVDSSALPEQVIQDVITSAFNSAGQRCSALRVLFLQEDIADKMLDMLKGAMKELTIGDPFLLSSDIGPVIDESAKKTLEAHLQFLNTLDKQAKLVYRCELPQAKELPNLPRGAFFAPAVYEINHISLLKEEVFGPILHVIRFKGTDAGLDDVISQINSTGYGLTLGIHSRINDTVSYIHNRVRVGNTYVNRNMIGAVVGVQPFGGEGLSGTGPKAGGPHILPRLATERTLSVNIAATGGNAALMNLED